MSHALFLRATGLRESGYYSGPCQL